MRFNYSINQWLSGVLFIVLIISGFFLSQRKVLWIDEFYTQKVSIDQVGYGDIVTSHIIEGNKSPLFYLVQKAVSDIFTYHLPVKNIEGLRRIQDKKSQIVARIPSNVYMSLGMVLIFYFFAQQFSLLTAFYALGVMLVTPLVWEYWVEARPYSLWFLLTTIQLLLAYHLMYVKKESFALLRNLGIVQVLLALTCIGSLVQIFIVTAVLLPNVFFRRNCWWVGIAPLGIAVFYYLIFPTYPFKAFFFWEHIFAAFQPERMMTIAVYAISLWALFKKKQTRQDTVLFLAVYALFLASAIGLLITHVNEQHWQFGFFDRYFIYLVPIDIMMFTVAAHQFFQWSKANIFVRINIILLFGGLLVVRGLLAYGKILAVATFLNDPA